MTRTGNFIYLKTRGYLEIQTDSNKVHTFCCINTLVSEEEGKKLVREMKKKFSVIIAGNEIAPNDSDVPALEKPEQLERAVLDMITDLQNPDNESVSSPASSHESDARDSKSPPAIIAPTALTIKDSIKKTVGVIVAASRGIYSKISDIENTVSHRPSVLQKTKTYTETILNAKSISPNFKSSGTIIEIKTEPIDISNYNESTSRVPPLPNQKGYFDEQFFELNNQTTTPLSSPPENSQTNFEIITIKKSPHDLLYWDSCSQDESRFFELNGKSPTDTTKNEPIFGRNSSVLKRTHRDENYDDAAKRRIVFDSEGEKSSLLSPCITQLTNPNSGEF